MTTQDDPPAWRALIDSRWEALRRAALGIDSAPRRKLSELGLECEHLAIIVAWFEAEGNITHAAAALSSNRKTLREHIRKWRTGHPLLVPTRRDKSPEGARKRTHESIDSMSHPATHGERQP